MSDLRTAAQQALEALKMMRDQYEEYACPACDHADAAIYALKEALVEDVMQKFTDVNQELMAALGCDHCNHPLYAAIKCRVCGRETPIIEPEIKGDNKPDVADDLALIVRNAIAYINRLERQINELKRAAPPQRKPLPASDIVTMYDERPMGDSDMIEFARAIERAHGVRSNDA